MTSAASDGAQSPPGRPAGGPPRPRRSLWRLWDVLGTLVILGAMYALVTSQLRLGPAWLLPTLIVVLVAMLGIAYWDERHGVAHALGFAALGVGTGAVLGSVAVMVVRVLNGDVSATYLLRDAGLLWLANIIVFGYWYWALDGGGPVRRHLEGYRATDLAFPQTGLGGEYASQWTPEFFDYLFVAFTGSAAFSPTDTSFLSKRAKLLLMVQSTSSLVILVVIAARAINILD